MEDNEKKAKLEKIEKTIEPLVKTQEYWVEVYKLLKSVEEQELYDPEYQSFTAWLKSFAERYDVTLTLLWLQLLRILQSIKPSGYSFGKDYHCTVCPDND